MSKLSSAQVEEYVDCLFRDYGPEIYKFVLSLMENKNEDEAEDVTQETFLRTLQSINSKRDKLQHPQAWLQKVAKNCYLRSVSGKWRHPEESLEQTYCTSERDTDSIDIPDNGSSQPDMLLETKEGVEAITEEIKALPEGILRDVVILLVLEYTPEEISRKLQQSPGSIRAYLSRARGLLRSQRLMKMEQ